MALSPKNHTYFAILLSPRNAARDNAPIERRDAPVPLTGLGAGENGSLKEPALFLWNVLMCYFTRQKDSAEVIKLKMLPEGGCLDYQGPQRNLRGL